MTDVTAKSLKSWKILIADDEQIVHDVTSLALKNFIFADQPLSFYHAYSGNEAREMLKREPDIAVILLDVVMESDDAGLQVVRYIRDDLKNSLIRIIIRTGLPEAAPEEDIIRDYDINDYKSKNELTIQKLKTTMYTSLRMYQDLVQLNMQRELLHRVIDSTANLFEKSQLDVFISEIRAQIANQAGLDSKQLEHSRRHNFFLAGFNKNNDNCLPQILSGNGRFSNLTGERIDSVLSDDDLNIINKAVLKKETTIENNKAVFLSASDRGNYTLIYFAEIDEFSSFNFDLMQMFNRNISIAYNNICFENG